MPSLYDYPVGNRIPDAWNIVVEIPKGSRNKIEYDGDHGAFKLDRVLSSPLHYVTEYGFFPQTLAGDGDAADVLVPMEEPTFPGCIIEVRPIGILRMEDEKGADEKIMAVPTRDRRFSEVMTLEDVPSHLLLEIEHFFTVYKALDGLHPTIRGWDDEQAARKFLLACHEAYRRKS
jgi:inorganic pyrophosphatase